MSGFPQVHEVDIQSSKALIQANSKLMSSFSNAIDVAGGMGRISKELLIPLF
jgi:hypothetical protein